MRAIPHWQAFLRGLRPADARQHERAPPRRAALPVRRPGRDHDARRATTRARRSRTRTASRSRRCGFPRACWPCRMEDVWSGPREEGYKDDIYIKLAGRGHGGRRPGHHRLADRRRLDADATPRPRPTGGEWVEPTLGHDVVPARLHRRDGAAAIRGEDRRGAGALGRRQRQDHGAGRGRLPLDRRRAHGQAVRDSH